MNRLIGFLMPYCVFCVCYAYEIETHQQITQHAAERSTFHKNLTDIGVDSISTRLSDTLLTKSSIEWMRYGVKHEDDIISTKLLRFFNHFYDPITGEGLSKFPYDGLPSLTWGLELDGDIYNQEYSYKDSLDYFYNSLVRNEQVEREKYLSLCFRTLGHVAHLIQDAGQPQHTRNDAHGGQTLNAGDKSLFEQYNKENLEKLPYGKYVPVELKRIQYYWTTKDGAGIADYTNRGFVTAGTNFDRPTKYSQPSLNLETEYSEDIRSLFNSIGESAPKGLSGTMTFFKNFVIDLYRTSENRENDKTTTYSLFSPDLTRYNKDVIYFDELGEEVKVKKLFTLNRFNFDSANKLLIPRAVGYSAGMINHFFRARLRSTFSNENDYSSVKVKNVAKDPMSGDFELYYNDVDKNRYLLDKKSSVSLYPLDQAITPGGHNPTQLTFNVTNPPGNLHKDDPYVVVFKGDTSFRETEDGPTEFEPAVTGFVLDNRKLAFRKPDGQLRKINPETGSKKVYPGQFGGSSRVKKHPSNDDLAIVYHPFKDTVHVIDYARNKTASIKMDRLSAWWLIAARWLDGKVMTATMGVPGSDTLYQYHIYEIKSDHTLEQVQTNSVTVENDEFVATGGWRFWGHWPGINSEYFDLHYGPYVTWYSLDILDDGTMVTGLSSGKTFLKNNSTHQTFHQVTNCTNKTLASEIRTSSSSRYRSKLQKVGLDGSVTHQDLNGFYNVETLREDYYDPPREPESPQTCYRGALNKKIDQITSQYRWLLHLDAKQDGAISEVAENGDYLGVYTWTSSNGQPSEVLQETRNKSYTVDGRVIETAQDLIYYDKQKDINIEEYNDIEFWDLQYDKNGEPWAILRHQKFWYDKPNSTYHFDTNLKLRSYDKSDDLLTYRHEYFEWGPPLEVADVVVDPYRNGVAAVVKVRDSSFYEPLHYVVDTDEFIRYKGETSVDLREKYAEEFQGVVSLQFVP